MQVTSDEVNSKRCLLCNEVHVMVPFEVFRELHTEIGMGFAHLEFSTKQEVYKRLVCRGVQYRDTTHT